MRLNTVPMFLTSFIISAFICVKISAKRIELNLAMSTLFSRVNKVLRTSAMITIDRNFSNDK